ncbi:MAG: tetratricopeptide repeat protein [Myxococcota bacterium]
MIIRLITVLLLLQATSAFAQEEELSDEDQRARRLYEVGDDLYSQGRYEEALAAFQEAYELSERPLLLFNIANAQERAGHWEEAVESLRAYLPNADESERSRIESRIESLERRVERLRQQNERPDPPPPPPEESRNLAGPVVLGAGGALLVGGVVLAVLARGARDDVDGACVNVDGRQICPDSARSDVDRDRGLSIGADVLFVSSAAAIGVGLFLLLRKTDDDEDDEPAVEADALLGPGSAGMVVRGRF